MLTNRACIPADSSHEIAMADALATAGRGYLKPLRYDTTAALFPDFVLTDRPAGQPGGRILHDSGTRLGRRARGGVFGLSGVVSQSTTARESCCSGGVMAPRWGYEFGYVQPASRRRPAHLHRQPTPVSRLRDDGVRHRAVIRPSSPAQGVPRADQRLTVVSTSHRWGHRGHQPPSEACGRTALGLRGVCRRLRASGPGVGGGTTESSQPGEETMGYLTDEVHRLAESYPHVPLNTVLSDLVEAQDLTFRLLESGRVKPAQGRDLYLTAAITAGLLAKSSHDLGDPAAAMRQARTAYVCAEQAGHSAMRGWVRGLQSLISYWAGRPEDALNFARRGSAEASSDGGTVEVWLAGLEARAHALVGDHNGVEAAVHRAESIRDRVTPDDLDTIGGLLTFAHARQLYYAAEAKVLLPGAVDAERTEQAALDAVHAYESAPDHERAFSDEAGARTVLALARIDADAMDGVEDAIDPVLDLPVEQRPAGVAISARRVHRALSSGPHRSAATARQLRARLEQFTATSPTPSLPG